jgi:hypothetical protein
MEHLRKKSIEEIYEALGKDVTERYVDKLIEKFHVLNSEEMPSYLKCTHNDEKAANMICYILQTLDGAKVTLKWLLNPNLYEVFVYEGYVDWRNDGIKYAEIILPYISNATQKSRIENAIHHAVEDIRNYRQKIAALMEIYEQKEQAYQAKMCEQCEVDPNKTELPYNETLEGLIGKYTQNNPGKIVMKNSSEYEFYLDSSGKWYIPGFLSNHTFKNTQEMLKYFLGECQKIHCK